jgi:hypothetical protein
VLSLLAPASSNSSMPPRPGHGWLCRTRLSHSRTDLGLHHARPTDRRPQGARDACYTRLYVSEKVHGMPFPVMFMAVVMSLAPTANLGASIRSS